MLSRRALLLTTAPAALALAGCASSGGTTTFNVAAFAQAIQAVSDELGSVLSALPTGTIAAGTLSTIQTIIADIQSVATGVSSVVTPAAGASLLTTIESYINELAPIVLPLISAIPGIGSAASIIGIVIAGNGRDGHGANSAGSIARKCCPGRTDDIWQVPRCFRPELAILPQPAGPSRKRSPASPLPVVR